MDFDLFLTSPRWEILQIIAEKPSSPAEIAEKLKTTVSYVSQQLKLLDAANLLNKEKTGAVEKGKPRTLFSLSNELLYLTVLTKNFSQKKLIQLTDYHKNIMKIWFLFDIKYHQDVEKLYWKLDEDLNEIEGIFIENSGSPKILIISESKKLKSKIDGFVEKLNTKFDYTFISSNQLKKFSLENITPLYDPQNFLEVMKGGKL